MENGARIEATAGRRRSTRERQAMEGLAAVLPAGEERPSRPTEARRLWI